MAAVGTGVRLPLWLVRPLACSRHARLSVKLRIDGGVDDDDDGDDGTPALLNLLSMRRTTDRYSQRIVGT